MIVKKEKNRHSIIGTNYTNMRQSMQKAGRACRRLGYVKITIQCSVAIVRSIQDMRFTQNKVQFFSTNKIQFISKKE